MPRTRDLTRLAPLALGVLTLLGCSSGDFPNYAAVDQEIMLQASVAGVTGDPLAGRNLPAPEDPLPQLGMRLFFSRALGGDRDSACVTCHHPLLGGGDDLALPIGVGAASQDLLGPGRVHSAAAEHHDGGPTVPRNAPTTFNIALYDRRIFHDGRVESLMVPKAPSGAGGPIRTPDVPFGNADPMGGANLTHAQARFPVTSPEEMKAFSHDGLNNQGIRDFLAGRLGNFGAAAGELADPAYWLARFREGFQNPGGTAAALITYQNIASALSEYQRSQVFMDTPFHRFMKGDPSAMSASQKRGALLFFRNPGAGGAGCASCHSGDFFTDEEFHNLAFPQVGRGKGDGPDGGDDFGRFRETKDPNDMYAFRTPTLVNVAQTGPWGHAGAYSTIEAAIRHHLDPAGSLANYNPSQLTQPGVQGAHFVPARGIGALAALNKARAEGRSMLPQISLPDSAVDDLVAFMHALTDPCTESRDCLQRWIPQDLPDPNGDEVFATILTDL